jgi:hypothetical protein
MSMLLGSSAILRHKVVRSGCLLHLGTEDSRPSGLYLSFKQYERIISVLELMSHSKKDGYCQSTVGLLLPGPFCQGRFAGQNLMLQGSDVRVKMYVWVQCPKCKLAVLASSDCRCCLRLRVAAAGRRQWI